MALSRCLKFHAWPKGRTQQYMGYVMPVGYPNSSLICGLCEQPGVIWIDMKEAIAYANGVRVFGGPNAFARMKASDNGVKTADESDVNIGEESSADKSFEKKLKEAVEQFHRKLHLLNGTKENSHSNPRQHWT